MAIEARVSTDIITNILLYQNIIQCLNTDYLLYLCCLPTFCVSFNFRIVFILSDGNSKFTFYHLQKDVKEFCYLVVTLINKNEVLKTNRFTVARNIKNTDKHLYTYVNM